MPDVTITNLRVAPVAGVRVPTTWRAYPQASFLLNDASNTAVTQSSPYDNGPYYKSGALTADGAGYTAVNFTLPSTTDSPDNPNGARWGLFVFDGSANPRLMYPVAGLESFALDHNDLSQDAEEIIAFNLGGLPVLATGDRTVGGSLHVTGGLQVDGPITSDDTLQVNDDVSVTGNVTATAFVGSGAGLTGIGTGTGGVLNTGSTTIGADTDSDGVGVVDLQTRTTTRLRINNDGVIEGFSPFKVAGYATGSLPAGAERLIAWDTTRKRPVFHDGTSYAVISKPLVFNGRDYGADGSVAGDMAAIRAAIAAAEAVRGRVYLPGIWQVADTIARMFPVTKPIEIFGDGMLNSYLQVANTTGATTDIFYYEPAVAETDSRGFSFHDLGVNFASATKGRHSLVLDGSLRFIADFSVRNSFFGEGAGNSVIIVGPASGDGVFTGTIKENFMLKSPQVDHGGDTLRFIGNIISGPATDEFYISLVLGATTFTLDGNNITSGGGVRINSLGASSGVKTIIINNIIELFKVGSIGSGGALLNLTGISGAGQQLYGTIVHNNQFGSVSGISLNGISASDTIGLSIKDNTYSVPNGKFLVTLLRTANTVLSGNEKIGSPTTGDLYSDLGGNTFSAPFETFTATGTIGMFTDFALVTSGTFTLNLPAAFLRVGKTPPLTIKNTGAGTVTVDGSGAETIDGAANYSLGAGKYVQLIAVSSTAWIVVGNN
jgi:hypothetical protein